MSEPLLELNEDELLRERKVPSTVTESQLPSRSLKNPFITNKYRSYFSDETHTLVNNYL
jgi:hypothetical protein